MCLTQNFDEENIFKGSLTFLCFPLLFLHYLNYMKSIFKCTQNFNKKCDMYVQQNVVLNTKVTSKKNRQRDLLAYHHGY